MVAICELKQLKRLCCDYSACGFGDPIPTPAPTAGARLQTLRISSSDVERTLDELLLVLAGNVQNLTIAIKYFPPPSTLSISDFCISLSISVPTLQHLTVEYEYSVDSVDKAM